MFGVAANPADTAVSGAAKPAAAADALEVVVGCPVVVRRISAHSRRYMSPNGGFGRCFDRRSSFDQTSQRCSFMAGGLLTTGLAGRWLAPPGGGCSGAWTGARVSLPLPAGRGWRWWCRG